MSFIEQFLMDNGYIVIIACVVIVLVGVWSVTKNDDDDYLHFTLKEVIMESRFSADEEQLITEIKKMGYEEMLRHYRYDLPDNRYHIGSVGVFFQQRMNILKMRLTAKERIDVSAKVGW